MHAIKGKDLILQFDTMHSEKRGEEGENHLRDPISCGDGVERIDNQGRTAEANQTC